MLDVRDFMSLDKNTKKILISLFILLNTSTVVYINRPVPLKEIQGNKLKEILHSS